MNLNKYYLAIDLGATSGRHILAHKDEKGEVVLEEIYRFKTGMDESKDGLVWDIPRLFEEIKNGIKVAFAKQNKIESLSIDTWGVDYVLLDKEGKAIPPFYSYRNERLNNSHEEVHKIIPFEELYKRTGIQFATFNSIYALFDDLKKGRLSNAVDYLMLPSYFSYLLTGVKSHEYSNESTTGLLNPETRNYDFDLLSKLGLPLNLFKEISFPGTVLGQLKDDVAKEVGGNLNVVLCASHDTGSAFEAVEFDSSSVFISSGTWSLLGVKEDKPIKNEESYKANFTNEGGVSYIRFLKNIMGMWIPNEVSRLYNVDIPSICKKLDNIEVKETFDVNDPSLLSPKDMKIAVEALLKQKPSSFEELYAIIYHSLAKSFASAIKELEGITKKEYTSIYIVGGGAKNEYLNRITEMYSNKKVVAKPIEATSLGNIKVQMNVKEN